MPVGSAFANSKPFDPSDHRAYARVRIKNPASNAISPGLICLVDTGSDWTVLPAPFVQAMGLVANGPPVSVQTMSGRTEVLARLQNVPLLIEKFVITTEIAISFGTAVPIVGRYDLLSSFDIAFDSTHWYWE